MTLLSETEEAGLEVQWWRDDDCRLVKITIGADGEETEEDMEECACEGCWENR